MKIERACTDLVSHVLDLLRWHGINHGSAHHSWSESVDCDASLSVLLTNCLDLSITVA